MRKLFQLGVFASFAAVTFVPVVANAQTKCPEGIAANGQCVDPGMGVAARLSAFILSQPKISYTAYPILPTGDVDFRYPNQLNPNPQLPASTGTPLSTNNNP